MSLSTAVRPALAFAAFASSVAVWPGNDPFERPKLIAAALGLGVAAFGVSAGEWRAMARSPLLAPLIATTASYAVSIAANGATLRAFWGSEAVADGLLAFLVGMALILALQAVRVRPGLAKSVLNAWLAGAAVAAGYAILQRLGLDPIPWGVREAGNLDALAYRPFGTLGSPSFLAMTLSMALPVGLWAAGKRRLFGALALVGCGFALGLTMSRAGIVLGFLGLGTAAVLLRDRTSARHAALGGAALLVGCIGAGWHAPISVGGRFSRLGEGSTAVRGELARAGLRAVAERPLAGWGPGNATEALLRSEASSLSVSQRLNPSFHNLVLDAAGERGALGLFALLWLGLTSGRVLRTSSDRTSRISIGLALAVFLANAFVGFATVGPWLGIATLMGLAPYGHDEDAGTTSIP